MKKSAIIEIILVMVAGGILTVIAGLFPKFQALPTHMHMVIGACVGAVVGVIRYVISYRRDKRRREELIRRIERREQATRESR